MFCVFIKIKERGEDILGDDGFVHGIACGDGSWVYIHLQVH